jgi:5-methylcytosine-specific restriction endonuclease McrA
MATPRLCPHCNVQLPVDRNFSFDEKLNLICGYCGEIAFPTDKDSEIDAFVPKSKRNKSDLLFQNQKKTEMIQKDEK